MNKLSIEKKTEIIKVLCEGNSLRSTARITDTAINTVVKLLRDIGSASLDYQDKTLVNLTSKKLQCDEIWSFCYSKQKNVPEDKQGTFGYGDVWTWTALDADTKLIASWLVGLRTVECANQFIKDLKDRLTSRIQLTTDGNRVYVNAIEKAFGPDIDYAILDKIYGQEPEQGKRYSPSTCIGAEKKIIEGHPDMNAVSTSYVERQNLTMRMSMRRFTRLTNAFSKKVENHELAVALYFMHYNFVRPHKTLANPYPRTPAMAAGISDHVWTIEEIVRLIN